MRAKIDGLEYGILAFAYLIHELCTAQLCECTGMSVGMISHLVSLLELALYKLRIFAYIFTNHEEGSLDVVFGENVEDLGCIDRMRSVVKGKRYTLICIAYNTHCLIPFGIARAVKCRGQRQCGGYYSRTEQKSRVP